MARSRGSTFAPVVLFGLASAVLVAVAGAKPWAVVDQADRLGNVGLVGSDLGTLPLAGALGLLLLAAWGVLLVTRRGVRRALAVVALLVSLGLLACVVVGGITVPDDLRDTYSSAGLLGGGVKLGVHHTGWFWAAAVGAVLSVVATALAVRLVPAWPEMGTRYDAPGTAPTRDPADVNDPDTTNLDLWKSIDEGDDPTLSQ